VTANQKVNECTVSKTLIENENVQKPAGANFAPPLLIFTSYLRDMQNS